MCVCTPHLFICSFTDGRLDCFFRVLTIISSAAVNIGVYVFFRVKSFFPGSVSRSGFEGSFGTSRL